MSSVEDIKSGEDYDRWRDEMEAERPCDECGAGSAAWCWDYGGNLCPPCEEEFFDEEWWEEDE